MEGDQAASSKLDLNRRLGRLLVISLIAIAILEIPAILFSSSLNRENQDFRGFKKTKCTVKSRSVENQICQKCYNGGCVDEECVVPTYHVSADHMVNETILIRTQGLKSRRDAEKRVEQYKEGRIYSCYYRSSDPLAVRFSPRGYGAYVAGATISWLLIIVSVIAAVLSCYYR